MLLPSFQLLIIVVPGKQARTSNGSRHTELYTPIPGINLGFRHPSVQHEAGAHLLSDTHCTSVHKTVAPSR